MKRRRRRLVNRGFVSFLVAILVGALVGVGVSGLPDPEALNPVAGRPPLTVKPGSVIDPSQIEVPLPIITAPSSVPIPTTGNAANATSTTTSSTTTTIADGLRLRSDLAVMVANANRTPGSASQWSSELVRLGYTQPVPANAGERNEWTIYFADGYQGEAERLAQELAAELLTITLPTAPLARAPRTSPAFEGQILLVVGLQELRKSSPATTISG